jgi:hypothetical protein
LPGKDPGYFGERPAFTWNPLIQTGDGAFRVQGSQFGFNISSPATLEVVVTACTNLTNLPWTPPHTITLTNGSFYFSDPQWTNYPNRYYGLQMP